MLAPTTPPQQSCPFIMFSAPLARGAADTEQGAGGSSESNLHKQQPRQWRHHFPVASSQLGMQRKQGTRLKTHGAFRASPGLALLALGPGGAGVDERVHSFLNKSPLPRSREVKGPLSLSEPGVPSRPGAAALSASGGPAAAAGAGVWPGLRTRAPRPAPPASTELAPRALPGPLAPGPPPPSRGRGWSGARPAARALREPPGVRARGSRPPPP